MPEASINISTTIYLPGIYRARLHLVRILVLYRDRFHSLLKSEVSFDVTFCFNPLKCSGVMHLYLKVFRAIQV